MLVKPAGRDAPRVAIRIPYVDWRDGRPRFNPGAAMRRRLKLKGQDLKRADGGWMTAEEARAWVETELLPKLDQRRAAADQGRRLKPAQPAAPRLLTVAALWDLWLSSPRMAGRAVSDGRREVAAASPHTVRGYRLAGTTLERSAPLVWTSPAAALKPSVIFGLHEDLWRRHGLATARATRAALSAALTFGIQRGLVPLDRNPCHGLQLAMPAPRVRAGEPADIEALVAAADTLGLPEIGDAIMLGVWTGQRQADRLALVDRGLVEGRRQFRQSKTGAVVEIPEAPHLAARLAAARDRRGRLGVVGPVVMDCEGRGYDAWRYGRAFQMVRHLAMQARPGLRGFRDQDLRDTAVTWLHRAGCTHAEISAITGHSLASIAGVLRHYSAPHPEIADNAMAKLVTWRRSKG
jgi:integrase